MQFFKMEAELEWAPTWQWKASLTWAAKRKWRTEKWAHWGEPYFLPCLTFFWKNKLAHFSQTCSFQALQTKRNERIFILPVKKKGGGVGNDSSTLETDSICHNKWCPTEKRKKKPKCVSVFAASSSSFVGLPGAINWALLWLATEPVSPKSIAG